MKPEAEDPTADEDPTAPSLARTRGRGAWPCAGRDRESREGHLHETPTQTRSRSPGGRMP